MHAYIFCLHAQCLSLNPMTPASSTPHQPYTSFHLLQSTYETTPTHPTQKKKSTHLNILETTSPYKHVDRQQSLQRLSLQIQPSGLDFLANTTGGSTPSSPSSYHAREYAAFRRMHLGHQRRGSALALSSLEPLEEVDRSGIGSLRERKRSRSEIDFNGRR